jgi:hypothetical protein
MTEPLEEISPVCESKKKSKTRKKVYQFLFTLTGINTEKIDAKYNLCNIITDKTLLPVNTTRISDLSLDIKTPEIISFLDETKKLHKCYTSMIDFKTNQQVSNLKYNCFWDRHPFNTLPIGCPINFVSTQAVKQYYSEITRDKYVIKENVSMQRLHLIKDDKRFNIDEKEFYESDGVFCSFNCCNAFIKDNKHCKLYNNSETLLAEIYKNMFGKEHIIESAPHWRLLDVYGGHLTIEQFRNSFNKVDYEYHGINRNTQIKKPVMFKPIASLYEEHIKL